MRFRPAFSLLALAPTLCTFADTLPLMTKNDYDKSSQVSSAQERATQESSERAYACSRTGSVDLGKTWSAYLEGSFLYWYAQEEGLFLARDGILTASRSVILPLKSKGVEQDFEYKPAFKVSFGLIYDTEWEMDATYTWFHSDTHKSKSARTNTSAVSGEGVLAVPNWFLNGTSDSDILSATKLKSKWKLKLNMLDVSLKRPFLRGEHLTISPHMGLRAAWIAQRLKLSLDQAADSVSGLIGPQPIRSKNRSSNFGIGPRIGLQANCLLGGGWSLQGHGSGSLLATWFTKVKHKEDASSTAIPAGPYRAENDHQFALLPNAELGLGLGWGTYLGRNQYHLDFAASYDYVLFWEQNKMRQLVDNFWNVGGNAGDLSFNGLTVSAALHF